MRRPVFINDMNIISPLGFSTAENLDNVLAGRTGLSIRTFPFSNESFCVGYIEDALLEEAWNKQVGGEGFTKLEKMSILSIKTIVDHNNIDTKDKSLQFIYCTTKGNIHLLEPGDNSINMSSLSLASMASKISRFFGMVNTPIVISNACISGLEGIITGCRLIETGLSNKVVVCGGDLVTPFTLSGFRSLNALSDEPCLPFDKMRKGINLGEAAASILLSSQSLSTTVQVMNGSITNDAHHISAPSRTGQGLLEAILKSRQLHPHLVPDFICAHGTATLYNDEMEALAINRAGLAALPVFSLKGYFGHTLGTAGLLETIIAAASLIQGEWVISKGYSTCGVSQSLQITQVGMEASSMHCFLKTASGFGGCNAAALFYLN